MMRRQSGDGEADDSVADDGAAADSEAADAPSSPGALDENWTRDLLFTKEVLYH